MASEQWQVMATHTIVYGNQEGKVEVVQTTNGTPEFFFFVHFATRKILLTRYPAHDTLPGEFWNGTSLSVEEAGELALSIQQQIGYALPHRPSNNPFDSQDGDRAAGIEKFGVGDLSIERAKAIFTDDVYYRISFAPGREAIMVHMLFMKEWTWAMESPGVDGETFEIFKSLLQQFEEAYQLGIYSLVK